MRKLWLLFLLPLCVLGRDVGVDNLTVTTATVKIGGLNANDIYVVNQGTATIYGAANIDTNTFNNMMSYTNATAIKPGYPVNFSTYNNGKIASMCLATLSGSSAAYIGSGRVTGGGLTSGGSVVVTNTVNVSIVNTNDIDVLIKNSVLTTVVTNTVNVAITSMPATDGPTAIAGTPQDFTASWVDLGAEIDCSGFNSLVAGFIVDINDSVDCRIRALAKFVGAGANEYLLPIKTPSATVVAVSGEYYELTDDADQNIVLQWDVDNSLPFVQLQIQAGTVGATAGQIDGAENTLGFK